MPANVIGSVTGTVTGTVASLVGLLVIPILAYYLLVEFDDLLAMVARWIPPRNRDYVIGKARQVDQLISAFLRGQITIGLILGVLYAVGFTIIGIDLAVRCQVADGTIVMRLIAAHAAFVRAEKVKNGEERLIVFCFALNKVD